MLTTTFDLVKRPRRNRQSASIRQLACEHRLHTSDLVIPLFLHAGSQKRQPISAMPGIDRLALDSLIKEAEMLHAQGIPAIALFPKIDPSLKTPEGNEAWNPNGLVPNAIQKLKAEIPSLCVIVDVALDPYTSHGHDGIINAKQEIDNDLTIEALVRQSLAYAEAGCDILAPSDMMDGRVGMIRRALDEQTFKTTGILSYCVKYASSFYGPFREALGSAPSFGDKKTYQMDPPNIREAIREAELDEAEGADMLMVKPALPYLDVIAKIKEKTSLPVGAYQVSGEYAMIMAAYEKGWIDAEKAFYEALIGMKRAGADFIFTYAVKQIWDLLN